MAEDESTTEETPEETPEPEGGKEPDLAVDVAKWKAMARKHEQQAKTNAAAAKKLAELEDANKSEIEKASEAAKTAQERADAAEAKALRYEVALDKGVPKKLMKFLTGSTAEDIEASADELLEALGPDTGGKNTGEETSSGGRPKEKLRPGADTTSTEDEGDDPREIAKKIPRSIF